MNAIKCDGKSDCPDGATYIDSRGWAYCARHAPGSGGGILCRKLRPHEVRRLERGEALAHY